MIDWVGRVPCLDEELCRVYHAKSFSWYAQRARKPPETERHETFPAFYSAEDGCHSRRASIGGSHGAFCVWFAVYTVRFSLALGFDRKQCFSC